MPREIITIECTEARKEGKSPSRYTTTRNKKLKTEKLEIKKYNPLPPPPHSAPRNQVMLMPRKTNIEKDPQRPWQGRVGVCEMRTPRPKPKIDFTVDALDYKNVNSAPPIRDGPGPHSAAQIHWPARALSAAAEPRDQARPPDAADAVIIAFWIPRACVRRGVSFLRQLQMVCNKQKPV